MPLFGQTITGFIAGEPIEIERSVYGVTPEAVLVKAELWIKRLPTDANSQAIVYNVVTTTAGPQGQIDDDGSNDGVGSLSFDINGSANPATVLINPLVGNTLIKYTAVTAGQLGNNITIAYVDPGLPNQALEVTVNNKAIVISLATDAGSVITTTAAQVVTLVNTDPTASALVTAVSQDAGTGIVAAVSATNLSGGNGGTGNFRPNTIYDYYIQVTLGGNDPVQLENGTITFRAPKEQTVTKALTSEAEALDSGSLRIDKIVNNYVDSALHELRSVIVWDEHARRSANDPTKLWLTYKNWNRVFPPEVWDAQNNRVDYSKLSVNYEEGSVRVDGDDGYQDYFVTYHFNPLPAVDLQAFLELTLQELNIAGAAEGGFITTYTTIDGSPTYWDAPLAIGVIIKSLRRIISDSVFWRNFLIWADGEKALELARQTAEYYGTLWQDMAKGIKKLHIIAQPSQSFKIFETVGFGFFSVGGGKFRELRLNRLVTF